MSIKISVVGGDLRQEILAGLLKKDGFDTQKMGFSKNDNSENISIYEICNCDILILPLPVTYDNTTVNAPLSNSEIRIDDILSNISHNTLVLGGNINEYLKGKLDLYGIAYFDYFKREELIVRNAVATAEGAVEIALSEMPITLHSCNALVLGFGRIGKVLSKLLYSFGANVSTASRKYEDLAWIHTMGYSGININNLSDRISDFDVIFNTVPAVIMDKQLIRNIRKNTLIIDLASKPGGVDFEAAKQAGLHVIWALSLPGKVAPITSGKIIEEAVLNILNEMGVI